MALVIRMLHFCCWQSSWSGGTGRSPADEDVGPVRPQVQLDRAVGARGLRAWGELAADGRVRGGRVDPGGDAGRHADLNLLVGALEAEDAALGLEHADRAVGGAGRDIAESMLDGERP